MTPDHPFADNPNPPLAAEPPEVRPAPRRRGQAILAWVVILLLSTAAAWLQGHRDSVPTQAPADERGSPDAGRGVVVRAARPPTDVLVQLQARYVVGAQAVVGKTDPKMFADEARKLNAGPLRQRMQAAVLLGQLASRDEAGAALKALDANDDLTAAAGEDERQTLDDLRRLYEGEQPSPQGRERIKTELGWIGDLAVATVGQPEPADTERVLLEAKITFGVLIAAVGGALVLAGFGALGAMALFTSWLRRSVTGRLHAGSPYAGVYAETFAVWMFLYGALTVAAAYVPAAGVVRITLAGASMLAAAVLALGWPVLRGVPWAAVRDDVGLTAGKNPVIEVLFGFATYAMALPVVAGGLILMFVIMAGLRFVGPGGPAGVRNAGGISGKADSGTVGGGEVGGIRNGDAAGGEPGNVGAGRAGSEALGNEYTPAVHPVLVFLSGAEWAAIIQIFFFASVVAPVVEETMFRGCLYGQLRQATDRFGAAPSVLLSAVVVSFIFAVIHPQGLIAAPLLGALAFSLAIAREWRGSLLAPIIAHATTNALTLGFVTLCLSRLPS